jgi:uncharacterized membrane protein
MVAAGWQRSNLLSILLLVSLAANFFLAGWLLGSHSGHHRFGPPPPPPFDHFFNDHIRESLSPDGVKIMEEAFDTIRKRFSDHAAEARSVRDRLTDIMKADPFNPSDYIAASKAAHAERDSDHQAADEEIARAIARLSADDRRRLAEIRRHAGPPGPGRRSSFEHFHWGPHPS